MTDAHNLFEYQGMTLSEVPASRKKDVESSHVAEDAITKSGQRHSHCSDILVALERYNGSTSRELNFQMGFGDRYEIAKRLSDLRSIGEVGNCRIGCYHCTLPCEKAEKAMRKCDVGKRTALTWWRLS